MLAPEHAILPGSPNLQTGLTIGDQMSDEFPSDEIHEEHTCDIRMCPLTCELCKRLCVNDDHLHGLDDSALHLCG